RDVFFADAAAREIASAVRLADDPSQRDRATSAECGSPSTADRRMLRFAGPGFSLEVVSWRFPQSLGDGRAHGWQERLEFSAEQPPFAIVLLNESAQRSQQIGCGGDEPRILTT